MSNTDQMTPSSGRAAFIAAFLAASLYFVIFHLSKWWPVSANMDLKYDAILRLELVRNLLAEGTWYDNTLPDVLPPDGFVSHWSRYVDAAIAGVIWLLSLFMAPAQAEVAAVTIWPLLIYLGILWALGRFAFALFGLPIACLTLMGLSLSPLHFMQWLQLGNIDHHGLQLLLATLCIPLLGTPGATGQRAVWAGLACALVFTVSLDSIFFVAGIAFYTGLSWAYGRVEARFPAGFLSAFGLGVWGLFAIENHPSQWSELQCDAVSGPYLMLAAGACATAIVCIAITSRITAPLGRIMVFGAAGCLSIAVAVPFYAPCFAGPYAAVSPITNELVLNGHPEVIGLATLFQTSPTVALATTLPLLAGTAVFLWTLLRPAKMLTPAQRWALVLCLVVMLAGLIGALYQMRTSIYAYAPLPLAVAFWVHRLYVRLQGRAICAPLILISTPVLFITPLVFVLAVVALRPQITWPYVSAIKESTFPEACLSSTQLRALDKLPSGTVLSPVDYGARVLVHTHHATANLTSHRSPEGMDNALLPFLDDGGALLDLLGRRHIDYIVLCRGMQFTDGNNIGTRMAAGIAPDGFVVVDLAEAPRLVVYRALP